jgi:predicted O-methyltransferase YrrM
VLQEPVKGFLRKRPLLYRVARAIKGDRLILLDYPVNPNPRYGYGRPLHPLLLEILEAKRIAYKSTLESLMAFKEPFAEIPAIDRRNPFLPGLDSLALYSLLSLKNPKTYLEVGSGYSTKFARRAIRDHMLQARIISVDPHPTAEIDSLCDVVIRQRLEDADLAPFFALEAGDFVFMDGSHRCLTNSDVTVFFLDILPRLRAGVFVEIHDIHLPYDYPPEWAQRYWSEQYLLAAYLLADSNKLEVVLPNWFVTKDADLSRIVNALWDDPGMEGVLRVGASFWMETK